MQRRGQMQFRTSDKSPNPYTRVSSTAPTSFNGRNLDIPRGRVHSPGETVIWKTNKNHNIAGMSASENYLLPVYKRQNEDTNNDFRFTSQTSNSFPTDFFTEDIENRFSQTVFKLPVHKMGNLNLIESELRRNVRDERAGNGKGANLKREIEQKNPGSEAKNNHISEDSQFRRRENLSRILTGPVEKVMNWFKLKNYFHVLFEVIAILVEIKEGSLTGEKCLVLRDERSGPSLFVKYYEIDIKLPPVDTGSVVKCIGRLTSRTHFQAFKVALSSEEERNHSQRLFFISNLVAEEAKTFFMKK